MSNKPHIVDGYLYRPSTNVYSGKPTSYPVKSYSSHQLTGGTCRKEKAPERRGVEKKYTPPPPEQPLRSAGGGAGGAPNGGPPHKGPPGGGHDDDSDNSEDDEEDDDNSDKEDDEYKQLGITPGPIPVIIGKKIFYVQPAIVEHDLSAPGGRVSPSRLTSAGGGGGPPPLAHKVLSLDLEVKKVIKEIKVTREIEVQEVKKVTEEILVYKELLVYQLELMVFQWLHQI